MKARTLILITFIIGLIFWGCDNSTKPKEESDLKSEALDFSLKVIKSYIENDTTAYKTFLSDTLYLMESSEEPIPTSSISVTEIFSKFDYSNYTMGDFNNNYSSEIFEYNEYKNQEWVTSLEYWHPDSEDYLFITTFIEGSENFMWRDLRIYVVTKRSGEWKIRAITG